MWVHDIGFQVNQGSGVKMLKFHHRLIHLIHPSKNRWPAGRQDAWFLHDLLVASAVNEALDVPAMKPWQGLWANTLPATNSSPLKIYRSKRKRSPSNHPFSGVKMLVSGRHSALTSFRCFMILLNYQCTRFLHGTAQEAKESSIPGQNKGISTRSPISVGP